MPTKHHPQTGITNGWRSPDGSFFPAVETERSNMARHGGDTPDFGLGMFDTAAVACLEEKYPALIEELNQQMAEEGITPIEAAGTDLIKNFMAAHGFVRVAAD